MGTGRESSSLGIKGFVSQCDVANERKYVGSSTINHAAQPSCFRHIAAINAVNPAYRLSGFTLTQL